MSPLNIQLSDDLKSKAQARAVEAGHGSVEAYVEALIRADVGGDDYGAPEHLTVRDDAELEALLTRRLENTEPGIEATPEFWQNLREEARRRREQGIAR
jgi:hypothetical protein